MMASPLERTKDFGASHGVATGLPMQAIPILQLPAFLGPDTGASLPDPRKVFVGGLASSVNDDGLRDYFEGLGIGGVAEAIVMMDKDTLRSRGFGFVTFIDEVRCAQDTRFVWVAVSWLVRLFVRIWCRHPWIACFHCPMSLMVRQWR